MCFGLIRESRPFWWRVKVLQKMFRIPAQFSSALERTIIKHTDTIGTCTELIALSIRDRAATCSMKPEKKLKSQTPPGPYNILFYFLKFCVL